MKTVKQIKNTIHTKRKVESCKASLHVIVRSIKQFDTINMSISIKLAQLPNPDTSSIALNTSDKYLIKTSFIEPP